MYLNRADISIRGNKLIVGVNSRKRAEEAEKFFKKLLKENVGTTLIVIETVNNKVRQSKNKTKEISEIDPQEAEEIIVEYKNQYYRKWLDESFPILDGYTPRQMSKRKDRAKLIDLLKDLESNEIRQAKMDNATIYDVTWIKEELNMQEVF